MQNMVIDMCEKFHYERLRNNRALGNGKSGNNKNNNNNNNNVGSAWGPVSGSKKWGTVFPAFPSQHTPAYTVFHKKHPLHILIISHSNVDQF